MDRPFADRRAAGRELAPALAKYAGREDVVVLGVARGGVPVAYEVASALGAPLDVLVVRKLGVPRHEELAMGAIASGGVCVLNDDVLLAAGIGTAEIDAVTRRELRELRRQERLYRGESDAVGVHGAIAIAVDDGLATGATMRAAVAALRERDAASIVVAVPIASPQTCAEIGHTVEEIVCLRTPEHLGAVGVWFYDFLPTSDDEVRGLLRRVREVADRVPSAAEPRRIS